MDLRNHVAKYLLDDYWDGDFTQAASATFYSVSQIQEWIDGTRCPQKATIEYLMHMALVPEFKLIVEFGKLQYDRSP